MRKIDGVFTVVAALATVSSAQVLAQDELPKLDGIMKDLVEIRGLEFKRDVPSAKQSLEEFGEYLKQDLEESFPIEEFDNVMDGLVRLGLVKERFDLDEAFTDAIMSQAAAYYDPETGTFYYLMTDIGDDMLRSFASHELVHALQDQHFDLDRMMQAFEEMMTGDGPRNDDLMLALRCLIEGEATYVQNIWQMKDMMGVDLTEQPMMEEMTISVMANMGIDEVIEMTKTMGADAFGEGEMAEAIKQMENIPRYILEPLYAAYMKGAYFTMKIRQESGWEGLNAAWNDLPTSTEQCLHPEKYLAAERDQPTVIHLPDFRFLEDSGWVEIDSAIHGELYLNMLLREQGDAGRAADRASAGWDGDVYRAYRNGAGEVLIILATTWDTARDAREFYRAYERILPKKYAGYDELESSDARVSYRCGEELDCGVLVLNEQEVFIVEGADAVTCDSLIDALTALPIERVGTVSRIPAGVQTVTAGTLTFEVPSQWAIETPANDMRKAQILIPAADGTTEPTHLIVFHFGDGHGGAVDANIARWDSQIESDGEPVTDHHTINGLSVHTFMETGRFVAPVRPGATEQHDKSGYALLGAIVETDAGAYYFRVVGPEATTEHWHDELSHLLHSIRTQD